MIQETDRSEAVAALVGALPEAEVYFHDANGKPLYKITLYGTRQEVAEALVAALRPEREEAGLRAALERLVNISTPVWKRIADDPDYRGPYYETCELDDALSVARVALWITKHDDPHAS